MDVHGDAGTVSACLQVLETSKLPIHMPKFLQTFLDQVDNELPSPKIT